MLPLLVIVLSVEPPNVQILDNGFILFVLFSQQPLLSKASEFLLNLIDKFLHEFCILVEPFHVQRFPSLLRQTVTSDRAGTQRITGQALALRQIRPMDCVEKASGNSTHKVSLQLTGAQRAQLSYLDSGQVTPVLMQGRGEAQRSDLWSLYPVYRCGSEFVVSGRH